jgi:hypothetical protein
VRAATFSALQTDALMLLVDDRRHLAGHPNGNLEFALV